MILTQTTLMDVKINEIRSTISSGDSSLLIIFAFKFSFFWEAAIRCWGRVFGSYALNLRRPEGGNGVHSCRDAISVKLQSNFG